jgi:uncharacterized protein YjbI with pentapeptide repeats
MVSAKRAPVRPRVITPSSSVALPLEDEVQALLDAGVRGIVHLVGPPGSGKSTALQDLAARVPPDAPLELKDEAAATMQAHTQANHLVVIAATAAPERLGGPIFRLAPWGKDDVIEYLLGVHRPRCAAVMARLPGGEQELLRGLPELWQVVLDQMAADPSLADTRTALLCHLKAQLDDPILLLQAQGMCLEALTQEGTDATIAPESLARAGFAPTAVCILRHAAVQMLLAAEGIAADLCRHANCDYLALCLPRPLVQAAGRPIASDERALSYLYVLVSGPGQGSAMAASLLHSATPGWAPEPGQVPVLAGAYLDRVDWPGIQLPEADLRAADLEQAHLEGADLSGADVSHSCLSRARLPLASLEKFRADDADLSHADLTAVRAAHSSWIGANLEEACLEGAVLTGASFQAANLTAAVFAGADLQRANFSKAELRGADFSSADLREALLARLRLREANFRAACFAGANLAHCDLEGMELAGANFHSAKLTYALLTDAVLKEANFQGARLRYTGLGDINLERACLRDADLRGATFHMGSTRSGMLITPIASEGTRTGFYTDDADEQNFKAPEEIRKANLRGADLRGARIDDVDFYLVDLRDALYDAQQERHFRRCRAILEGR